MSSESGYRVVNYTEYLNVDTPQGLQTAKQIKPKNLLTLAQSNSLMRLMPDSGNKTPVEEFVE